MTEYSLTLAKATSAALGLSKSVAIDIALVQPYTMLSIEDVESGPVVIAPVADFAGSAVSGNAPLTVNFTDLSTNTPTSWAWDFGDATTSTSQNPTKIYTVPGVYTVTLVATNAAGSDTEIKASYIVAAFNPLSLFTGGYQGGVYDPSDLSTLWQDSARTTPVTADGDPVGCIDDKSGNGNHLKQATAGLRPLYKTSGGLHWLEFDGIDDTLNSAAFSMMSSTGMFAVGGIRHSSLTGAQFALYADGANRVAQIFRHAGAGATNTLSFGGGAAFTDATGVTVVANTAYVATSKTTTTSVEGFINRGTNGPTALSGALQTGATALSIGAGGVLKGRVYQIVLVNKPGTSGEISDTEAFVATKSGVTL